MTQVRDLAAEFGISPERVMAMLKEMDIFARSALSPVKLEQAAMLRARWEREKSRVARQRERHTELERRVVSKTEPTPAPDTVVRLGRRPPTAAEFPATMTDA